MNQPLNVLPLTLAFIVVCLPIQLPALQPLKDFLNSGKQQGLENKAAEATLAGSRAESWASKGRLLPRITGQGANGWDQYPALSSWGGLQPQRTTVGSLAASLPLIDAAGWMDAASDNHTSEAAGFALERVRLETDQRIAQSYYALVAAEALKRSYKRAQETAQRDLEIAQVKQAAGAATALDVARSRVEVAAAAQAGVDADQDAALAARSLRSLAALTPSAGVFDPVIGTLEVEPLEHWEAADLEHNPAVKEATARRLAAQASAAAASWALLPVLGASFTENESSVGDDQGHNDWYQAAATLTWSFGVDSVAEARAKASTAKRAAVEEALARRGAADAVNAAWQGVMSGKARSQAAGARLEAARLAADLAEQSFQAGAGSHRDLIEAQRDLTQAEGDQIKANTELLYSRAVLRLAAGLPAED